MNVRTEWVALYNGKSPPLFRKKGSAAGQPCKQGQTATRTGCIPKKGKGKYKLVGKGSREVGEDAEDTSPLSTGDTSVVSGKKVKDKGDTRDGKAGTGSDRQGSRSDVGGSEEDRGRVERKAKEPSHESADSQGPSKDTTADKEALRALEQKQKALSAINDRIDRYSKVFEKRGDAAAGEWMKVLKDHINKVGIEDALESLGEQKKGGFQGKVQYEGAYDEPGDTEKESAFIRKYLEKAGVILIHGDSTVDPNAPLVSGWSESNLKLEGRERDSRKGKKGDYIPTEATFKDKLEETQHLPGLESTQDIQEAIGQRVTHFTPEVMRKLDAKYGKGKWIVKSYGEEAYAGFGVMFPERVKQIKRDARALVSAARDELKEHGYKIARDEEGMAIGLSPSKGVFKGHLLHFGSEEFDRLPKAVKILGKQVRQAAPSERGTRLPVSTEDALQNNYGVTLRRGKDGVPNGIIDWDGTEHALSSKHVAKMEKQDGGALGQDLHRVLEADEWRRDRGFSAEAKYMVGPAFKAVGVSAADRAEGNTWETANEGRVHCITRDGKATVVPYATLAGRSDSMPAVFATKDVRAMEKAVEDTINKLPESERKGQLYAPDVVKTKHGWRVLELNPSAAGGGSDWLGSNPFVIDAIASHVVGREPMHARFIRDLIGKVTSKREVSLDTKDIEAPKISGTPKPTPEIEKKLLGLNPGLDQPLGDGKRIGDVKNIRWVPITETHADTFPTTSNMAEDQPRDDHGRFSTIGAVGSVRKLRYGNSSVKFKRLTRKKIDGPRLGLINYRQKDDHSCSYVASLSVVHHFDRKVPAIDVLKAIRPKKAGGLNRYSLQKGLSKLGIETTYKNNLTLATLRKHVEEGTPVMITVFPEDWSSDHWTVVEGFSGDRVHLSNYKSLPIKQFMKEWYSKGEGLICKKKKEGESGTENRSTSVRCVPVAFISNSRDSQGQPCKQGQTVAKTDCTPKDLKGHRVSVDTKPINANDVIGKSNKELLQLLASSRSDNETIHEGREDYKVSSLRLGGVKIYYDPGNRDVRDAVTEYVREISTSDIPKEILSCTKEIRFLPGKCPNEDWYHEHHNITGKVHATALRGVVTFWRTEETTFPQMDVLAHESGHNFAWKLWGSSEPPKGSDYANVQRKEHPVSRYAANMNPSEDFAEACMWYSGYKPMRMYKPESLLSRVKGVFGRKKVPLGIFDGAPTEGFFERTGKEGRDRAKKEFKEKFPKKYAAIDRLVKGETK